LIVGFVIRSKEIIVLDRLRWNFEPFALWIIFLPFIPQEIRVLEFLWPRSKPPGR
jgi:hypothetical protein